MEPVEGWLLAARLLLATYDEILPVLDSGEALLLDLGAMQIADELWRRATGDEA